MSVLTFSVYQEDVNENGFNKDISDFLWECAQVEGGLRSIIWKRRLFFFLGWVAELEGGQTVKNYYLWGDAHKKKKRRTFWTHTIKIETMTICSWKKIIIMKAHLSLFSIQVIHQSTKADCASDLTSDWSQALSLNASQDWHMQVTSQRCGSGFKVTFDFYSDGVVMKLHGCL